MHAVARAIPEAAGRNAAENTLLALAPLDILGMELHVLKALSWDNAPVMPRIVLSGRY